MQAPVPLTREHQLNGFDCGQESLNEWVHRYANQAQSSGSSRTFVVTDKGCVVGYFSLTVGQVDTKDVPDRIKKGMGQYPIPVILLARLAVDKHHQGQGIGAGLLKDAILRALMIAEQAGVRAMMTHPINEDATRFYKAFGFEESPLTERQLLILLKDAKKYVK